MSSHQRSHVRRQRGGKRGECLSERESQLRRASVCKCVCVWVCEIGGSGRGERRHTHTPADAATCTTAEATATLFTSEPSSVRLSWSSLLPLSWACLWALCVNGNAWKEMPAKEWLMRTSAPVWRVTPCVRTTTTRGELDARLFHDDYNGLQSVHFTEARGTLQAAVWDCTGERRHGRLWHQLCVCVCCCVWFIMRAVRRALSGCCCRCCCCCCCCLLLKIGSKPTQKKGVFQGEDWKGANEGLIHKMKVRQHNGEREASYSTADVVQVINTA